MSPVPIQQAESEVHGVGLNVARKRDVLWIQERVAIVNTYSQLALLNTVHGVGLNVSRKRDVLWMQERAAIVNTYSECTPEPWRPVNTTTVDHREYL